jgi:hypothetical protein
LRLGNQVLTAAEADLQPDRINRAGKQRLKIGRRRRRDIDAQARQQRGEQFRLAGAQPFALAPAVERAGTGFALLAQLTARFRLAARSVCSQEKPPSRSGARPKWP